MKNQQSIINPEAQPSPLADPYQNGTYLSELLAAIVVDDKNLYKEVLIL